MTKPGVLYLVPDLIGRPGGIARYCHLVCRSLVDAEVPLHLIALHDKPESVSDPLLANLHVAYQGCRGSRLRFAAGALFAALRHRPSLLLIGHPHFSMLGWVLSHLIRAPYVVFIYGEDAWEPLSSMRRWALAHADRIIAISSFTAREGARVNRFSANRVKILHNCLDPELARVPESHVQTAQLSMLTVARMGKNSNSKGQEYVIQALPSLQKCFPQLSYHIVGDGERRDELERLAAQYGVAGAVCFHGSVSDDVLRQLYFESSLFVMPSRAEGFGFVFLEAMAQGTPVIGGNVDATPEVIVDGETGFVVNPTSVDEITEAAARLLSDVDLRRRMGEAGRQLVAAKFSYDQFQTSLLTILADLGLPYAACSASK